MPEADLRRSRFPGLSFVHILLAGALACWGLVGAAQVSRADAAASLEPDAGALPPERPDDPPGIPALPVAGAQASAGVTYGRFHSVQVNVDPGGANIPGDAGNEPSIAVDPTNHLRMAIGWRQFDTIASNFREAGYAYSTDGGVIWTKGEIQSGTFRSDPVLDADDTGRFLYLSLLGSNYTTQIFPSYTGGSTWGTSMFAYGGDKPWMTIDRTGGLGNGFLYQAWSTAGNPTPPYTFDRSTDGGAHFQDVVSIPNSPIWGTLAVAPDGTLYVSGTSGPGGPIYVARSSNAQNGLVPPTFTTVSPDLGGAVRIGGPNPVGLVGQIWIAVDPSAGPRAGWVYVLASVQTPTDPADVMFIRSTDGGQTWSSPVRVNDDLPGDGAWQWFGTMSVAPDGRIEAVWNDTRATADSSLSALYYSYSSNGGTTWSANEQASPVWDSRVGWPNQSKIGDYYDMVSDMDGADLAWAATFNGEQDVYYLRIPRENPNAVLETGRPLLRLAAQPNPFTTETTIRFDLPPAGGRVRLSVFDVSGRRVATLVDGALPGGSQIARWSGVDDATGSATPPGVYLCRLETAGRSETRRLLRMR